MVYIIVKSTGDFQMRWNILSLSSSERESGKLPLGLNFIITILSVIIVFGTLGRYPFVTPNYTIFTQKHDFLCWLLIE